jgi:hypothetical protein
MQAMLQIDQHFDPAAAIEGVAVQGDALRCRQFHPHPVRRQPHRIETGRRALAALVLGRAQILPGGGPGGAAVGHQQHIAQFRDAGAADVGAGKAQDTLRPPLVAAGIAPASIGVVRARRHHTPGYAGAREDMAGAIGADEGVDMSQHVVAAGGR